MLFYHKEKNAESPKTHISVVQIATCFNCVQYPWGPLLEVAYDLLNHAFATKTKKENDPHEASFRELFSVYGHCYMTILTDVGTVDVKISANIFPPPSLSCDN